MCNLDPPVSSIPIYRSDQLIFSLQDRYNEVDVMLGGSELLIGVHVNAEGEDVKPAAGVEYVIDVEEAGRLYGCGIAEAGLGKAGL